MAKTKSSNLGSAIKQALQDYEDVTVEGMKQAVTDTAKSVKANVAARAPVKTGAYKKSWAVKKRSENAISISMTVHSRNKYQLAHLLEYGHALRGGGRTQAHPHIEPAEAQGEKTLTEKIERVLKHG